MIYHGKDLGDFYLVSNTGKIKGVKTGIIRTQNINHEGYYCVSISLGCREHKMCIKVHRAVAETFLKNHYNYPTINHIDGNKANNCVNNLEWCSYQYNTLHAIKNNLLTFDDKKKRVISLKDGKIFESISDAGRYYNHENFNQARSNISRALRNNGTAYGTKWSYV